MNKKIFIFSLLIVIFCQWFLFSKYGMIDSGMWADQAKYVETNNPIQYDYLQAYGHPGGPIIEGVILIHKLFNISYENALLAFMILFDSFNIALICSLIYKLRKKHIWWIAVLSGLALNISYGNSTPPSTIVSILGVTSFLLALFLFEKEKIEKKELVYSSLIIGLLISLRTDIGSILSLVYILAIKPKITWRQVGEIVLMSFGFFVLLDPFMWYMPIQHIRDLLFKIIFHYDQFSPSKLAWFVVVDLSRFTAISIFLALIFIFFKKRIEPPIPNRINIIYIITTIFLYIIFLTANYQAPRYFLPLVLIWQSLLPLFIFSGIDQLFPKYSKKLNILLCICLSVLPGVLAIMTFFIYKGYKF